MTIESSFSLARHRRRRSLMPQPFKHRSGVYYIRLKLPAELRPVMGREWKRSLDTRDPAEAKRKYPQALLEAHQAIALGKAQLSGAEVLVDADIDQLAARWYRAEATAMEARSSFAAWLEQDTIVLEYGNESEEGVVYRALRDAIEDDDDEADLTKQALRYAKDTLREHSIPVPTEGGRAWGLLQLFDKYAEEKVLNDGDTRSVRNTLDSYRRNVEQFVELCGDLALPNIGRETVQEYRALLVKMPAKREGIRGLTAKELIAKADAESLPRITAATVRNKLLGLSAVFSYGVRMGRLAENPVQASGIGKAAKRAASVQADRSRRRKNYTHEEIESIHQPDVRRRLEGSES